jgi:hypothetical protein
MHKDVADAPDADTPMHPRLRGLLLNEELEPEEVYQPVERGYRELMLFTGEKEFMKTRDIGGPVRRAPEKEREFKAKEKKRDRLLRERIALSVKPAEDRSLPPPANWSGKTVDPDGTWDAMAWDSQNAMLDADANDSLSLECLLHEHRSHRTAEEDTQFGSREPSQLLDMLSPSNPDAWDEEAVNQILIKSTEDVENGFDYGISSQRQKHVNASAADAGREKDEHLPWYEQGKLLSSMLLRDEVSDSAPREYDCTSSGVGTGSVSGRAENVDAASYSQVLSEEDWAEVASMDLSSS